MTGYDSIIILLFQNVIEKVSWYIRALRYLPQFEHEKLVGRWLTGDSRERNFWAISFLDTTVDVIPSCHQHSQALSPLPGYEPGSLGSQGWPSFVYPLGVSPHLPGEQPPSCTPTRICHELYPLQFYRFLFCVISPFARIALNSECFRRLIFNNLLFCLLIFKFRLHKLKFGDRDTKWSSRNVQIL